MSVNEIKIEGNLVRDPATKFTNNGTLLCEFSIAFNHFRKEGEAWVQSGVSYFDCVAWKEIAEAAAKFKKGEPLFVSGQLKQERWEKDGKTNSKVKIEVREVRLADWAKKGFAKASPEDKADETLVEVKDEELPPF
jgi:single-strand DNA-binding protein